MFIYCMSCGEIHTTEDLEVLNCEEGPMGEDVITYICPETKEETKAVVRRNE